MTSDRKEKGFDFNVEHRDGPEILDAAKQAEIRRAYSAKYASALSTPEGEFMLDDMTALFCGTSRSNDPNDLLVAEGARRAVEYMRHKKIQGLHLNSLSGGE